MHIKSKIEGGVIPAMATPLQADGQQLNEAALEKLIDFLVAAGASGLFVGGTTGEGILLATAERKLLHERAMAILDGRIPALIHVGANTTTETLALTQHAARIGADAIVAVTPHFYPIHDDALLAYYQAIATAAPDTPLFAYDIPQQAINSISPALLPRLAGAAPTLAGIKTSRADAQIVRRFIDAAPAGVGVYAGNEQVALGLLALGANGLISGLATAVPEPFVALTRAFAAGNMAAAGQHQRLINQIIDLLPAGARIGAIKSILAERGIAAGPAVPPRPMPPDGWRVWPQIEAMLAGEQ